MEITAETANTELELQKKIQEHKRQLDLTYAENQRLAINNLQLLEETKAKAAYLGDLEARIALAKESGDKLLAEIKVLEADKDALVTDLSNQRGELTRVTEKKAELEAEIIIEAKQIETDKQAAADVVAASQARMQEVVQQEKILEAKHAAIKEFAQKL